MTLDPAQFFCPVCGETIPKSAMVCRFCKSPVTKDLILEFIPEDTKRSDIAKLLVEKGPKEIFPTFGTARKKLESTNPFLTNVKLEDVEKIIPLLEKFKISVAQSNHEHAMEKQFPMKTVVAGIVILGVGASSFFYYKKMHKPEAGPLAVTADGTIIPGDSLSPQQPNAPLTQRQKADHANIEALLISTATVMLGDRSGSAFFVSHDGHLISNQHVTLDAKEVDILTYDGKTYKGTVLKTDPYYDLSLIKIPTGQYPPLKIGDATTLHAGDTVWTIGAPQGLGFSVTRGVASYIGRNVGGKAFIQADVAINPGNSGGAMIDDDGEIIGINNFIIKQAQGLNFAIPVNYLFMGPSPILKDVIDTTSDNVVMATWRSWEHANANNQINAVMQNPSAPSDNSPAVSDTQITALTKQMQELDQRMKTNQLKLQAKGDDISKQIGDLTKAYGNNLNISDQQEQGKKLKQLKLDLIDVEIASFDEYLRYNHDATDIIQRAKEASSADPLSVSRYNDQLGKLTQGKADYEGQKNQKMTERKALSDQQF